MSESATSMFELTPYEFHNRPFERLPRSIQTFLQEDLFGAGMLLSTRISQLLDSINEALSARVEAIVSHLLTLDFPARSYALERLRAAWLQEVNYTCVPRIDGLVWAKNLKDADEAQEHRDGVVHAYLERATHSFADLDERTKPLLVTAESRWKDEQMSSALPWLIPSTESETPRTHDSVKSLGSTVPVHANDHQNNDPSTYSSRSHARTNSTQFILKRTVDRIRGNQNALHSISPQDGTTHERHLPPPQAHFRSQSMSLLPASNPTAPPDVGGPWMANPNFHFPSKAPRIQDPRKLKAGQSLPSLDEIREWNSTQSTSPKTHSSSVTPSLQEVPSTLSRIHRPENLQISLSNHLSNSSHHGLSHHYLRPEGTPGSPQPQVLSTPKPYEPPKRIRVQIPLEFQTPRKKSLEEGGKIVQEKENVDLWVMAPPPKTASAMITSFAQSERMQDNAMASWNGRNVRHGTAKSMALKASGF